MATLYEDLGRLGLTESLAAAIQSHTTLLNEAKTNCREVWTQVSKLFLSPDVPFEAHLLVFNHVFNGWDHRKLGPIPLWYPTANSMATTNVVKFMRKHRDLLDSSLQVRDERWFLQSPLVRDWRVLHALSVQKPDVFWSAFLQELGVRFFRPPHSILERSIDGSPDSCRWLSGALFNIAECALQVNDLDAPAIVYGHNSSPDRVYTWTHYKLRHTAHQVAVALRSHGQAEGCRVAIIGDMTPMAIACYLAVVLVGGAVVSVAPSFSAEEIAVRLALANTSLVITQETQAYAGKTLQLYSKISSSQNLHPRCVVIQSSGSGTTVQLRSGDMSWDAFMQAVLSQPQQVLAFEPTRVGPETIMNILFSSGTTGAPKKYSQLVSIAFPTSPRHTDRAPCSCTESESLAAPHQPCCFGSAPSTLLPHVSLWILALCRPAVNAWSCQDVRGGDVVAWPTSLGWMMGPWLIFASLLNRASLGLFLGAPTSRPFCQFVSNARITMLGVIPSIVKAWRLSSATDGLDWSSIRCFSSSGEASNAEDMHWLMSRAGYKPVMEYCGGTEVAGAFLGSTMLHPCVPSSFSTPSLGFDLYIMPPDGSVPVSFEAPEAANIGLRGEIAIRAPAMGISQQLLNRNHHKVYYEGMPFLDGSPLRRHGDEFEILPGVGYVKAHGRCDDTMNLGGIKVGSVEIERVIVQRVTDVQQAAAVAFAPSTGGPEQLALFLVPTPGGSVTDKALLDEVTVQCKQAIRKHLNPLFKVHKVVLVGALPRNASNKVLRRVLREQALQLSSSGGLVSKL